MTPLSSKKITARILLSFINYIALSFQRNNIGN